MGLHIGLENINILITSYHTPINHYRIEILVIVLFYISILFLLNSLNLFYLYLNDILLISLSKLFINSIFIMECISFFSHLFGLWNIWFIYSDLLFIISKILYLFLFKILLLSLDYILSYIYTLNLFLSYSIIDNCNHKILGIYYISISFIYGIYGTLYSLIIRIELISSSNIIIISENQNFYNSLFTLHGILMIFFLVMPALYGGFGNYFIPIEISYSEVGFPRINLLSFILLFISFIIIILSIFLEFGGATAWTIYPPLSTSLMNLSPIALDFIINGLVISGISSLLSSINYIITIFIIHSLYYYPYILIGILLTVWNV